MIAFNQFGDSALNINVVHWCKTTVYTDYLRAMQEINLKLKLRLDEEHIEFAFPSRTVYVKYETPPEPAAASASTHAT